MLFEMSVHGYELTYPLLVLTPPLSSTVTGQSLLKKMYSHCTLSWMEELVIPTTFSAMHVSWKLLSSRLMLKRVRLIECILGQYTLDYGQRMKNRKRKNYV